MFGIERNSMQAVEIAENHVQWHLYVDEMPTGLYIDLHLSDDAETTTSHRLLASVLASRSVRRCRALPDGGVLRDG